MASEAGSRSSSAADSYIGSLISLTSKSEIRYEGVLYNINTEESSIGLRNVRSFGTEGRKKDGPQVPPSDMIFEYILFRGSDIKDLQVKSSPPIQPTPPQINNDPAIIQSHYPRPVSTSTSLQLAASGSLPDMSSHAVPLGLPGSNFQNGLPLYQPGGNLGSWGASPPPPPNANGGGLTTPMYWQGYYGLPNGLPHMQQQSLLRPPPGLSMPSSLQQPMPSSLQRPMPSSLQQPMPSSLQHPMPSSLPQPMPSSLQQPMPSSLQQPMPSSLQQPMPSPQQPMQYSTYNVSLPIGASNFPEIPNYLLSSSTSQSLLSASVALAPLPSSLPPVLPVTQASESLPNSLANKAENSSPPVAPLSANLTSFSPLTSSGPDISPIIPPITNKPNPDYVPTVPYQSVSQSSSSVFGTPSSVKPDAPVLSLVTPGQLLQFGTTGASSSQSSQTAHKDVEVVQVSSSSSEPAAPVSTEAQPPILPLPVPAPSMAFQKPNGAPFQNPHHVYRGHERGRGTGSSRPVIKFTEDFDFEAMNEKFNKDEVWGHLGKGAKSPSKEREWEEKLSDEDDLQDEDDSDLSKSESKTVYNKDDFFDTLSCNALANESHIGRTRYSQQVKIDTETFGDFMRYRGGRGGRGIGRGGRFHGGYYGRGNGYVGRGRGRSTPH